MTHDLLHHILEHTETEIDRVAVTDGEQSATYGEFRSAAGALAPRLRRVGIERGADKTGASPRGRFEIGRKTG